MFYGRVLALLIIVFPLISFAATVHPHRWASRASLLRAAERGDAALVRRLLRSGESVALRDSDGWTALHIAAAATSRRVVALLVDAGAAIDARTRDGDTPLHWAVRNRRAANALLLLERNASPTVMNNDGETPLHIAALRGDRDLVIALIARGALPAARDNEGRTPLHMVDAVPVALALLERGASLDPHDNDGETPLFRIVARHRIASLATMLVERGANINARDRRGVSPLFYRYANPAGDQTLGRWLMERGMRIDLAIAALHGDAGVLRLRMAIGNDVNAADSYRCTPLYWAAAGGSPTAVSLLIDGGARVNPTANDMAVTPLHVALSLAVGGDAGKADRAEVVRILLERGAAVNARDAGGAAPLHYAAQGGNVAATLLLLKHGANVNARDADGETALFACVGLDDRGAMCRLLLARGAWPTVSNVQGETPLHRAVALGDEDMVRELVTGGADLSAQKADGETPGDIADRLGYLHLAAILHKDRP